MTLVLRLKTKGPDHPPTILRYALDDHLYSLEQALGILDTAYDDGEQAAYLLANGANVTFAPWDFDCISISREE